MTAIKQYLLRLILCALLVSLASALAKGKRGEKAAALCGGCLLILSAVKPLLQVDPAKLPDLVTGLSRFEKLEEARQKNDALLQALIASQAAEKVEAASQELGFEVEAELTLREAGAGSYVPDSIILRGSWTAEQREALSAFLREELDIPHERQRWEVP